MMHVGDILSTVGMFSTLGYHDKCRGYLEYRRGYHVHHGGLS